MGTVLSRRTVGVWAVLALALPAIAGCASTTTASTSGSGASVSSAASSAPASAGSSSAAGLTFCSAAKAWATAPAQEQFRKAVAANDNAGATKALLAWTAATKQMTAALPSDAPEDVRQAFATFSATIEGAGQGTVKTDAQGEFQLASQTVTNYVGVECTSTTSTSPPTPTPTE